MIGIICAMDKEVDAITIHMENKEKKVVNTITVTEGKIKDKDVVVALSGIGKVNAAIASTVLCTSYSLSALLNVGVAGGLKDYQHTMDVILADTMIQHDFDVSPIDGEDGYGLKSTCDTKLVNICKEVLEKENYHVEVGNVASGDVFVTFTNYFDRITKLFPTCICAEMEGGAISATANKFNVPCLVIRSLSDVATHTESEMDYLTFSDKASVMAGKVLVEVIEQL